MQWGNFSSAFCHPHFVIRILSSAFFHPHFIIRNFPSAFYHTQFSIRISSSAFFFPPSAAIRSSLYRDPNNRDSDGNRHPLSVLPNRCDPWIACHDSYDPNNGGTMVEQWWNNGDLHIIIKTAVQPLQYDPHDPSRLWNDGLRVVQLVNCIDIYLLMISSFVEIIRPVNGSKYKHTKDNACSSFWNRECPRAQNTN